MPKYNALSINPDKNVYSTLTSGNIPQRGGFRPGKYNALKSKIFNYITGPWDKLYAATQITTNAQKEGRKLTPEESEFITDAAMDLSLSMGTFIGAKGIAKLGKSEVLRAAEKMKMEGVPDKEIWNKLGTTFGFADKLPRMEISDAGMKLTKEGNVLHPELFEAYPDLHKIKTDISVGPQHSKLSGSFSHGTNQLKVGAPTVEGAKTVASHELQHSVQGQEGFPTGGSLNEFTKLGFTDAQALEMYKRIAGEAEARLTHSRRKLTDAQRRLFYPIEGFDIPVAQQIIRKR